MRHIYRSTAAVVLVFALSMPANAAGRTSGSRGILQAIKRLVVRVVSRISPPVGSPELAPEEPVTTTTEEPVKAQ